MMTSGAPGRSPDPGRRAGGRSARARLRRRRAPGRAASARHDRRRPACRRLDARRADIARGGRAVRPARGVRPAARAPGARCRASRRSASIESADGHVAICAPTEHFARGVFAAIGHPEFAADPRFATRDARVAHDDEMNAAIEALHARRSDGGAGVSSRGTRRPRSGGPCSGCCGERPARAGPWRNGRARTSRVRSRGRRDRHGRSHQVFRRLGGLRPAGSRGRAGQRARLRRLARSTERHGSRRCTPPE